MQVVEEQHERLAVGQQAQQLPHRVMGAVALVRRANPRAALRRRQHPRELGRASSRTAGGTAHVLVQRVDEDPERQLRSSSDALPESTRQPRSSAIRPSSASSRVLPMPGSPRSPAPPPALERALIARNSPRARRVAPQAEPRLRRYVNSIPFATAWAITFSGSAATARTKASNSVPGEKIT